MFLTILVSVLLSFFSTAIMSYISMATVIGPWIDTTLVLIGMLIFYLFKSWYGNRIPVRGLGLATAAGGIGGILATAAGFTFPTLFFIDNALFCSLMKNPGYFAAMISVLAFAGGSFGLVCAHIFERSLIVKQELPFPIGELVYKMISAADNMYKAVSLAFGFGSTTIFLIARSFIRFLSQPLVLLSKKSWGLFLLPQISMQTDLLPMFWGIGFVTGHVIAVPLLLGMIARIACIGPLHQLYPTIQGWLFEHGYGSFLGMPLSTGPLSIYDFTIAFCGGMVLYGAIMSFLKLPSFMRSVLKNAKGAPKVELTKGSFPWMMVCGVLAFNLAVFHYFSFSWLSQLYLLGFSFICTYQMMLIAGKIGIAPLGRFATLVLIPGMFLFGYNPLQITVVSMYVELAGGVACDALFGRKMGRMASINQDSLHRFQWLGLLISCLVVGIVFWIFINHFGIGDEPGALAAARGASRALLINVRSFDLLVLLMGVVFGYFLWLARVNAVLMLGGILMAPDYSAMLILGGLSAYLVKDKEEYYPFWSGVFAANSLWMLLKAFI